MYPLLDHIPWLLPHPRNSLLDWGAKLNHFQRILLTEIAELEQELKQCQDIVRPRLEKLWQGKKKFVVEVTELLQPLTRAKIAEKAIYDALRDRPPQTQNLLSYEANVYRDWLWGEKENQLSAEAVGRQLPADIDQLLVLGAGACRLACDVHIHHHIKHTVATDINPLLLFAASNIIRGKDFSLTEFPLHPLNTDCIAVQQTFSGLKTRLDNFSLVFADAAKPAFKPAAFDVVLTPWLIDIQPHELSRFLRQLNTYLPVGGLWVNFGSLVFNQRRDAYCYSINEITAIAEQSGFRLYDITQQTLPYLKSPYNAGHRVETVWTWRAEKIADTKPLEKTEILPDWILDLHKPIPKNDYFEQFIYTHRTWAILAAEVDGRSSIAQINKRFSKKNNIDVEEGERMLRQFFIDLHYQSQSAK